MTDYVEDLLLLVTGFKYENCDICGKDADAHEFAPDAFGLPHAYCMNEFTEG